MMDKLLLRQFHRFPKEGLTRLHDGSELVLVVVIEVLGVVEGIGITNLDDVERDVDFVSLKV